MMKKEPGCVDLIKMFSLLKYERDDFFVLLKKFGKDNIKELKNKISNINKTIECIDNIISIDYSNFDLVEGLDGHKSMVYCAIETRDGKNIISGSSDGEIKIWDKEMGECVNTIVGNKWQQVRGIIETADGNNIISCSSDGSIKIWDKKTFKCIKTLTGHRNFIDNIIESNDGNNIISSGSDGTIKIWNKGKWKCIHSFNIGKITGANIINSIFETHDSKYILFSINSNNYFSLLNIDTEEIEDFDDDKNSEHNGIVNSVIETSDGKFFVSCSKDHKIKIWDKVSKKCIKTLDGHLDVVNCVIESRDKRSIISSSNDGTIKIWDKKTWECIKTLIYEKGDYINSIFELYDGSGFVSNNSSSSIYVWGNLSDEVNYEKALKDGKKKI